MNYTLTGTPIGTVPTYSGFSTSIGGDVKACWDGNGNTLTKGDRHTRIKVKADPTTAGRTRTYNTNVQVPK